MALALRNVTASEKLVLLALANYADEDMRCWPSQKRLAEDTCLTDRTMRTVLAALEERGVVSRVERRRPDGSRATDIITVHLETPRPQQAETISAPPEKSSGPPEIDCSQAEAVSGLTSFEPSINHQRKAPSEPERARRATRLAADWSPSETQVAFALKEGLTADETERAACNFRDHWLGAPGARGTKLDWPATWRKWVRTEADRKRERGARLAARPAFAAGNGRSAGSFADEYLRRHGAAPG
jgi:hypothetical protein